MTTETPGKIVSIGVTELCSSNWSYEEGYTYKMEFSKIKPENTYLCIFGPYQDTIMDLFMKDSRVKIIYQAKKAVNRREGHGTHPRNTLFVWEFSPDTAQNAPT